MIPVGAIGLTVTAHVAFTFAAALHWQVITADPGFFAVTVPEEETTATDVLLLVQETALFRVSEGLTVAVRSEEEPGVRESDDWLMVTDAGNMAFQCAYSVTEPE